MKQPQHTPPLPDIADSKREAQARLQELMDEYDIVHFKATEFKGQLPDDVSVMLPVIMFADEIRKIYGSPIQIISHFRPFHKNQGKGQSPRSQHLWARALDLKPMDGDVKRLHTIAKGVASRMYDEPDLFTGVGKYKRFVHIDVSTPHMDGGRTRDSRW